MKILSLFLGLVLTAALAGSAHADPQGDMTRALVGKYGGSVVTLRLVLKSASGGGDQAQLEAQGIVIDPSGMVATTNTAIDPYSALSGMLGGGDSASTTSVASIRIRLASGEELPARVVLRDKDRNLAIVRPLHHPVKPLTAVNFKGAASARIGDAVYIIGRLGKAGSRQSQAAMQRVVSVVDKPRRMYVLEPNAYMYLGNVVFTASGQPLGLLSMRITSGSRSFSPSDSFLSIVIPTADVWEVALQAPEAKAVRPETARPVAPHNAKPAAKKAGIPSIKG